MPTVYSRQLLSGSTNGKPIQINATSSPGTTIHTVQATATAAREEVHLYAVNVVGSTATGTLTFEFGGTGTDEIWNVNIIGGDGLVLACPGLSLTATTSIVRAYATATGEFHVVGWVNRAT